MDPVSCVSCVSSCYCVNAGETHETFRQESGMRYQASSRPDSERESGCFMSAVPSCVPLRAFVHDSDGSSRYGETNWVKNARDAGRVILTRGRCSREFTQSEVLDMQEVKRTLSPLSRAGSLLRHTWSAQKVAHQ